MLSFGEYSFFYYQTTTLRISNLPPTVAPTLREAIVAPPPPPIPLNRTWADEMTLGTPINTDDIEAAEIILTFSQKD